MLERSWVIRKGHELFEWLEKVMSYSNDWKRSWVIRMIEKGHELFEWLEKVMSYSNDWKRSWVIQMIGKGHELFEWLEKITSYSNDWKRSWVIRLIGKVMSYSNDWKRSGVHYVISRQSWSPEADGRSVVEEEWRHIFDWRDAETLQQPLADERGQTRAHLPKQQNIYIYIYNKYYSSVVHLLIIYSNILSWNIIE